MGYSIELVNGEGDVVQVPYFSGGSNRTLRGTTPDTVEASITITYNYAKYICEHLHKDGLWWLKNKMATETIEALQRAINILGTERDRDYWRSTPGNAGYVLSVLLEWAKYCPEGRWDVS